MIGSPPGIHSLGLGSYSVMTEKGKILEANSDEQQIDFDVDFPSVGAHEKPQLRFLLAWQIEF